MEPNIIPVEEAGTLYGLLRARTARTPDAVAYRQFDKAADGWVGLTWQETLTRTDDFASAFAAAGAERGDRVAILLQNCIDWVCFDMGAHKCGLPVVPLYTNDAVANMAFLISDSRPRVILVDTLARWEAIADALEDKSFIEEIWVQGLTGAPVQPEGPVVRGLDAALQRGEGTVVEAQADRGAPAVLIYTSGTTGAPKGVILTHVALLRDAEAVAKVFPSLESDVFLSILPLAHGFERTMGYLLAMIGGACVAYAQSLLRLRQDLTTIRPTVIMGVPRLYESIYESAHRAASASPIRLRMFETTSRIGWERFAERSGLGKGPGLLDRALWPLLDRLVARRVQEAFGGRLRVAVSGGANFPPEIGRALVGLGVPMVEGYGLTEAGPVVTASTCARYVPGSVGFALPGIETKCTEGGELLIRSPSNMRGYWNRDDATAEMIDSDGWMRTGDLVRFDGDRIVISGRLKHILVLSNGENVNPLPLETMLEADPLFQQVCAAGDGRPYLTVLLVLSKQAWEDLAAREGLDPEAPNDAAARKVLMPRIKKHLKDFPAYQQIRAYHATLDEWTVERRLLTPTLKLRRERVVAAYDAEIRAMYAGGVL